ncbi:MAG TPA: CpaD family pilus assembly protein [Rhizomicrobium sp.]|jgi:pilus assembly protein CpaD|nr:CpaD family pilus assembly protein [Rhizomicrobium sp.]
MTTKDIVRFASLAAVLLAGSCAAPINHGEGLMADGSANHPIVVEPTAQQLSVGFGGTDAGLSPADNGRVSAFVADFLEHGNGAISVSVPEGPGSSDTITWFGEHLAEMGVPRSRILVGQHDGGGVELNYISYVAHTDECGDWSQNAGDTASNLPLPNFGCATQHNIAAQIADPRDLLAPRVMDPADAKRRAVVNGKYEQGVITQADKNKTDKVNEQSGADSDVGR